MINFTKILTISSFAILLQSCVSAQRMEAYEKYQKKQPLITEACSIFTKKAIDAGSLNASHFSESDKYGYVSDLLNDKKSFTAERLINENLIKYNSSVDTFFNYNKMFTFYFQPILRLTDQDIYSSSTSIKKCYIETNLNFQTDDKKFDRKTYIDIKGTLPKINIPKTIVYKNLPDFYSKDARINASFSNYGIILRSIDHAPYKINSVAYYINNVYVPFEYRSGFQFPIILHQTQEIKFNDESVPFKTYEFGSGDLNQSEYRFVINYSFQGQNYVFSSKFVSFDIKDVLKSYLKDSVKNV